MEEYNMKKTYQTPKMINEAVCGEELMQMASGVFGDGVADDIIYGGVDDGTNDPSVKWIQGFSVWDEE